MRLVLDTNVWLDWLIFNDPVIAPLRAAKDNGSIEIVIDDPCRTELARVLAYPKFALDDRAQGDLLAQADQSSTRLVALSYPNADSLSACKDPDDVKFQLLACASNADWLITKDNALLAAQRKSKPISVSYRAATPKQWALIQSDTSACLG
jgi:putative PIN family toxin of toxin-antitoxin system